MGRGGSPKIFSQGVDTGENRGGRQKGGRKNPRRGMGRDGEKAKWRPVNQNSKIGVGCQACQKKIKQTVDREVLGEKMRKGLPTDKQKKPWTGRIDFLNDKKKKEKNGFEGRGGGKSRGKKIEQTLTLGGERSRDGWGFHSRGSPTQGPLYGDGGNLVTLEMGCARSQGTTRGIFVQKRGRNHYKAGNVVGGGAQKKTTNQGEKGNIRCRKRSPKGDRKGKRDIKKKGVSPRGGKLRPKAREH